MDTQAVIAYENPCSLIVSLDTGSPLSCELPTVAERDAQLLMLWLYGKSEKTVMAYTRDLGQTTLGDLQQFSASLSHLATASRARTLAAVKSAMSFGAKMQMLPTNVGAMLELPKIEDTLAERIMSEESVEDILRLETDKRNHAMIGLLYYAGLRVSELCNLTWRNLQERDMTGQISVFGKGKKTRHVLLDTDTWREVWALRGRAGLDEYVFPSRQTHSGKGKNSRRLDEARVHQIVREAANRAGVAVDRVSPHWFRHAHATHALEAGASIALVKETLGHSSIETTARYTHVRPNVSSSTYLRRKKE